MITNKSKAQIIADLYEERHLTRIEAFELLADLKIPKKHYLTQEMMLTEEVEEFDENEFVDFINSRSSFDF